MKLKFKVIIIVVAVLFTFPMRTNAENLYYYESDKNGFELIDNQKYCFYGFFLTEEKIYILLENLFNNSENVINYIPEGTEIIDVSLEESELIVNVNENIKNYGGTNYEISFIKQILANAFQFKDVEYVTLLINGELDYLPEGSVLYKIEKNNSYEVQ